MKVKITIDELYPHYILEHEWNGGHSGVEIEMSEMDFNAWRAAQGNFYDWRTKIEELYEASRNK